MNKTSISWTEFSWNPLMAGKTGGFYCTKVSDGCKNCYAESMNVLWGGTEYKKGLNSIVVNEKKLNEPIRIKRKRVVFVCSMTDLFHEDVTDKMLDRIFDVMRNKAKHHVYQLLTKRIERARQYINDKHSDSTNLIVGTTVENQDTIYRIEHLANINTQLDIRFLSLEPLLSSIDMQITPFQAKKITQVIAGGESGVNARNSQIPWFFGVIKQCREHDILVFVKQMGSYYAKSKNIIGDKKCSELKNIPAPLRIRESISKDLYKQEAQYEQGTLGGT